MSDLQSALAAAERVFVLMDEIPETADAPAPQSWDARGRKSGERSSCPMWISAMKRTGLFCTTFP